LGFNANATVFTAVLSGNFSSATTWGGVVPSGLITTDVIIVPVGITVTLNTDVSFSGSSTLTVDGSLVSGAYYTSLSLTGGTLTGLGSINVDTLNLGLTTGLTYSGNITASTLTSTGATISSGASVVVNSALNLTAGTLSVTSGTLTLGSGSTINLSGGTLAVSGTGTLGLSSPYNVVYSGSSATAGAELSGSGLHNLTINVPGSVMLSSNLGLNGNLTLTGGTLSLNGHTLTLNSGADLMGSGTLAGSASSSLVLMHAGSLTSSLSFAAGADTLNNLTVALTGSGAAASLGTSLNVNGNLNMQSGKLVLGANNLNVSTSAMGGSSTSYVVADGAGKLSIKLNAGTTDTFMVGTPTQYSPMLITANPGSAEGNVSINVTGGVYAAGTTGALLSAVDAMVNNTWYVSSSATSGINYNMTAMWSDAMEVNGFDRTSAFISHYSGGSWDLQTPVAASTSGSLHTMTRTGITSLSPFMVTDHRFATTGVKTLAAGSDVQLYPNPATDELRISAHATVTGLSVYTLDGKLIMTQQPQNNIASLKSLPAGAYFVHLTGDNINVSKQLIKE